MITVEHLTKRYGDTLAADDLSFEVLPGHVTGFLGPNGSGKSTTMRVVLGLDLSTTGAALVNGRPYRQQPFPMRSIGALLDAGDVHPGRTAAHLAALAACTGIDRNRVARRRRLRCLPMRAGLSRVRNMASLTYHGGTVNIAPEQFEGLAARGVTKRFADSQVLVGADLTVAPGTTVAVLGPSGCGKTTLLRILAGFEQADSGLVTVGDRTLVGPAGVVPPERRRIGMVFQDWALFPHLTVAANVAFGLPRGERRSGRVEETLAMVGLEGLGDRMPNTLSGGQQQRVAIARSIAPRPSVILLDEPFSNLDADLRVRVRSEVHRLLRDLGITTVFVTHDQEEAFVLGDEVAVMKDGVIVQQATPAELYDRPVSPWIAGFVGEANLVPADAEGAVATTPVGLVPLVADSGGPCQVLVRPESLVLSPDGDGTVTDVEFYGHDTAYRVALPWGDVMVRAIAAPRFQPGDRVTVAYAGSRTMRFDPPVEAPARIEPLDLAV